MVFLLINRIFNPENYTKMTIIFFFALLFTLLAGTFYASGYQLPDAVLCTLAPISGTSCRKGSAGIAELYVIAYEDIDHTTGITWDADEQATAIPLVATKTWTKLEFQQSTAFFNQEKQAPGDSINFRQSISVNFPNNDIATRMALKNMDACCNLVAFIVDNQGEHRLAGIQPVAASGTASIKLGLKTAAGSYNTGADPQADENLRTVTLECNSPYEAPYTNVATSTLDLTP
jgi:hypothetical protein